MLAWHPASCPVRCVLAVQAGSDDIDSRRHGLLATAPEPTVFLDELTADDLEFVLNYCIELNPASEGRRIASDLRLMILGAFGDAGISLAKLER